MRLSPTPAAGHRPSATALRGELRELERKYADRVGCWTAKTSQGKHDIAELRSQIARVEAQLSSTATGVSGTADPPPATPGEHCVDCWA